MQFQEQAQLIRKTHTSTQTETRDFNDNQNVTDYIKLQRSTQQKNILPKTFSVALITTWELLSRGTFRCWKQSSAIIICRGLRCIPNGACKSISPTRRNTSGSFANQPGKNFGSKISFKTAAYGRSTSSVYKIYESASNYMKKIQM